MEKFTILGITFFKDENNQIWGHNKSGYFTPIDGDQQYHDLVDDVFSIKQLISHASGWKLDEYKTHLKQAKQELKDYIEGYC